MLTRSLLPGHRRRLPSARRGDSPVRSFQEQMNELISDFWDDGMGRDWSDGRFVPSIDVSETEDDIHITAEMPGIKPEDLNVELDGDILTLSGDKREETEDADDASGYHYREIRSGHFTRRIALPQEVDDEQVEATSHDGILRIKLRKNGERKKRRIEISQSNGS